MFVQQSYRPVGLFDCEKPRMGKKNNIKEIKDLFTSLLTSALYNYCVRKDKLLLKETQLIQIE